MPAAEATDKQCRADFAVDEWLEALLRCRNEQPQRYAREVSPGLQAKVDRYAALRLCGMAEDSIPFKESGLRGGSRRNSKRLHQCPI
jgi:hypothetical protein